MPQNAAAWLPAKYARLKPGPAPYVEPKAGEIVVRNHAVAINPVDWIKQTIGDFMFGYVKYPAILGSDVAGVVVEVGPEVTRFRVGDRVLGHAVGQSPERNAAAEGAFQLHTVLLEHMAAPIPHEMAFERAAVLPLGLSTAACGLFQKDHLALEPPSATPKDLGETVLIWGGSTSVGSCAIQLARAAGYAVVSTASPRNFDYVKSLGAKAVVDYNDPAVVAKLISALKGETLAGALAIGQTSASACVDVIGACQGRRFVSVASFPLSFARVVPGPFAGLSILGLMPTMAVFGIRWALQRRRTGVATKFIFGSSLQGNEVGPLIYRSYLPSALAEGRFRPAPEPRVVGAGLEAIQGALDLLKSGTVSAQKLVVSLR